MNSRTVLIILAVILLLAIAYFIFYWGEESNAPQETATTTPSAATTTPAADTSDTSTNGAVTITYGPNGFSPANVTIPVGTTVTWVNSGSDRMWIGSNDHPTHTRYDGSATSDHCANGTAVSAAVFDQCSAGSRYSFTFTKAGSWGYHNHARSADGGTVTVQ